MKIKMTLMEIEIRLVVIKSILMKLTMLECKKIIWKSKPN